jgi:hypothetical protein
MAAFIHVFHTIQMAKNGIRFNNALVTLHAVKMKVLTAISTSAPLLDGYTASSDMEHQILHRFHLSPKLCNAPKITLALWKAPLICWIKVSTDGSVTRTPVSAACGDLFHNHLADFIGCFTQKLGQVSVPHAEIMENYCRGMA